MSMDTLVSVVIPNYNGGATIGETIASVRGQTYTALEIIVVDDGSTDNSIAIVKEHASLDARVRLVRQANAGVAAARNNGWRQAKADLIAFVDSDDLWMPTKIERQVARIEADDRPGVVYCGFTLIDSKSNEIEPVPCATHEGWVLDHLILGNFIGNGSAALVCRWVLKRTNGFESGLHHADAQGCEDLLFYCRAAEYCRFGAVPECLVGYRMLPDAMSSDGGRMLKSWLMVVDEVYSRHPEMGDALEKGFRSFAAWAARKAAGFHQWVIVRNMLAYLARERPIFTLRVALFDVPAALLDQTSQRLRYWYSVRIAGHNPSGPRRYIESSQ
jgi:glycosyltransferase involved in cell wall biosynthesis